MMLNHRFIIESYYGITLRPEQHINHINHKKDDNRLDNLEIVTNAQNRQYQKKHKDNTSGIKGVSWHKPLKKWKAHICFQKKRLHLGYYDEKNDAKNAWISKALYLNKHHNCMYLIE